MTVALDRGSFRFSGLVCFESIFSHLARQSVRRGSQCLVVITNDGWFGDWRGGREQHLQIMQWIAMETRTPVIRAVNTGISTKISSDGYIKDSDTSFENSPSYREPWTEGIVKFGGAIDSHPPPPIYLGNFIDWFTLAFTALAVIVPMVPVGSRSDRSSDRAAADDTDDTDDDPEGPADADPSDSPNTATDPEPRPGGSA